MTVELAQYAFIFAFVAIWALVAQILYRETRARRKSRRTSDQRKAA